MQVKYILKLSDIVLQREIFSAQYEFFFSDALQHQENDCNCSITCERTLYEPGLSYAELSEFNIDQVALTSETKKALVREKFEHAAETQQRVVESIRESDKELMNTFLMMASKLNEAITSTIVKTSQTSVLSTLYQFPNILDADDESPTEDIEAIKDHANDLDDTSDDMKVSFWDSRDQLDRIISDLLGYDGASFRALEKIEYCMNNGMNGTEDRQSTCSSPSIMCDELVEMYCFIPSLQSLPTQDEGVFESGDYKDAEKTVEEELGKYDHYNETVEWVFAGQSLESEKFYQEHVNCSAELYKYQTEVMEDFLDVIDKINELKNVENLTQAKDIFIAIDNAVQNNLAPYLLEEDPVTGEWKVPNKPGDESEEEVYDSRDLGCYWYHKILDDELDDFPDSLGSASTIMTGFHTNVKSEYKQLVKELNTLNNLYISDFSNSVSAVEQYLDGNITKKNLSEYFISQSLLRSISELTAIKTDLVSVMDDFEDAYLEIGQVIEDGYSTVFHKTFPFVTDSNKDNYPFLAKMMEWYNAMGGKVLVDEFLQQGGNLKYGNIEITSNSDVSESNIWVATKNSIHGFSRSGMTQNAGLRVFLSEITTDITDQITRLISQYDLLISSMNEYGASIKMNTAFYK